MEYVRTGQIGWHPACESCPFWVKDGKFSEAVANREPAGYGDCHYRAPGPAVGSDTKTLWPRTAGDDWCGDHPDMAAWLDQAPAREASRRLHEERTRR